MLLYNGAMSAPLVRPYITYDDLCRLPADGNRYELIDGEAYLTPSPNSRHQKIVGRLHGAFRAAIPDRSEILFAPLDVVLANGTALQPDLLFIREANLGILQSVVHGAPDLVIEVLSPATVAMDRGVKMEAYARHGIGEYWIVDGELGAIEIYRLDSAAGAYRLATRCAEGERATTPLLPALSIVPSQICRA